MGVKSDIRVIKLPEGFTNSVVQGSEKTSRDAFNNGGTQEI